MKDTGKRTGPVLRIEPFFEKKFLGVFAEFDRKTLSGDLFLMPVYHEI